jgi:hypothetical protein
VHQNTDGTLELHFWQDLLELETGLLYERGNIICESGKDTPRTWEEIENVSTKDFLISCKINMKEAKSGGITWHIKDNKAKGIGFYPGMGMVTIGEMEHQAGLNANTIENRILDEYQDPGLLEEEFDVRIMVREHMAEFYINDRWIFTTSMHGEAEGGTFGFWSEGGDMSLESLRISVLEPLD